MDPELVESIEEPAGPPPPPPPAPPDALEALALALKTLTGLGLSPTKETWSRWHQAELYWLVRSKTHEFQRLRESDPAVAADALRTILTHPLARNELVAALPELLKSRWPAIRMLACNTLAELSATSAIIQPGESAASALTLRVRSRQ